MSPAPVASVTIDDVWAAASRIADHVVRTPMGHSRTLSGMVGAEVYVKFENLQFTGSFKDRGAANHLRSLPASTLEAGIVALSAGNHAQGVAHVASQLGVDATIVMPASAPFNKVTNTRALGATVVQHGATFADAKQKLDELRSERGYHYVPPYDDEAIIAGQGTVGLEMLADHPELDVLVVPIGGGGLVSGIAVAARTLRPSVEIIGVEIDSYAAVAAALAGDADPPGGFDTLADGIAVKTPGDVTLPLIRRYVDDVVVVSEDGTERAITLLLELEKTVAEGAGAVTLAALLEHGDRFAGKEVGLVLSGGNIDIRVLASVLMRGLGRTGRMSTLRLEVGDLPGQLAPIVTTLADGGANIIDVDHRRLFDPISARRTMIDIVIETQSRDHRDGVVASLRDLGFTVTLASPAL